MNAEKAAHIYPRTFKRIEQRAQEIANQTGCGMEARSARAQDGRLLVMFDTGSEAGNAILIGKPILELAA